MSEVFSGKKIAKNTLMLYFRQILILLVSLYTVRVVLNVLGAEDYGINNVVAGFVTMFNFLSSAMASASQRYFSYDLGTGDKDHLARTFSITFIIYFLLSFFVVLIAETLGLWFVVNKLVIPAERKFAAIIIYQFSIISFLSTLITTPYKADIIAHERMDAYAYISIIEAILKLVVVFVLKWIVFDKLIVYGLLQCIVVITNTLLYRIYAKRRFPECKFHWLWDSDMLKEMISYSGWNLFGSLSSVMKNQGLNIILNLFFGPVVNAARGVAFQVNNAVETFSQNFSTAMRPQIIKNYASGNIDKAQGLVYTGCKICYFLMFIFSLPLCLEMNYVLNLWLKNSPDFTVVFTQLVLINALLDVINFPVMTLAQATGKIKLYQGVVGGILLLNLPISYVFLKFGCSAVYPFIITIACTVISSIVRLFIVKRLVEFSICKFLLKTYVPCAFVSLVSFIVPFIEVWYMEPGFLRFAVVVCSSVFISLITMWFIGINKEEKSLVMNVINKKFQKNIK